MTSDLISRQIKRDNRLTADLCSDARHIRFDLVAWIQEELNDLINANDLREAAEVDGPLKEAIKDNGRRLHQINLNELPDAIRKYDGLVEDISNGDADNIHHAYEQLIQGQFQLTQLCREVLRIRDDFLNIAE